MISRLARLISKLDLIDRDVIHECSCSWMLTWTKNLIFLFGPVPKPEFGLSLIIPHHVTSIRITWIVRFLLHVFTVGSCDPRILFVKQSEFILELFQNGVNCENCENRRETPGSLTKSFFLESNIFLIKMRIFFFSCNSHGWTVFDFFFRLKENLRGRCGWCWTEKEKTKTDQN